MKSKLFFSAAALLLLSAMPMAAGNISQGISSIKFDRRANGQAAWQKIYVVNVINPAIPYSVKAGGILKKIKQDFASDNVEILAVLPCNRAEAEKFAALHTEFDFPLSYDENLLDLRKLLQNSGDSFNPASIFNHAGKLLWSGDPVDLPLLLKIITGKKYSERYEIRLGVLYSELQTALRSGSAKLIEQAADKILQLRPEQLSAVNAKAYALEMSGNWSSLENFFRSRIKRFPQAPENYIMLIEAAYRNPAQSTIVPQLAAEFMQNLPDDAENINALAWSMLTNLPFDVQALKAAENAVARLQKSTIAAQSNVLATRALLAYRQCDLAAAGTLAQQAQQAAKSDSEKKFLQELVQYFDYLKKSHPGGD